MKNDRKEHGLNRESLDHFNFMFNNEISIRPNPNYEEKCSVCGKTLTQEDSVKHKMGSKCRNNLYTKLLDRKMRDYDKELITDDRELEDEEIWEEAVNESIIKKINYLVDLVNQLNVNYNKSRDKNIKKSKKVVLNYASNLLNNLWDLESQDDDIWSNRNTLILSRSVQFQDKKILKFTVPNTNY